MSNGLNGMSFLLGDTKILELVKRLELQPQLYRRFVEEQVSEIVPRDEDWMQQRQRDVLGDQSLDDFLVGKNFSKHDLEINLWRPEALRRFADQRFSEGVEEEFLRNGASSDEVVYSLLRCRDASLARELWIRLEEKEASFSDLARQYGEGSEANHMGVIGPTRIGNLYPPLIRDVLRRLQPNEIHPPLKVGEWSLLIRLERLRPATFDAQMKRHLVDQQMNAFLSDRVSRLMSGEELEPLFFDTN